MKLQLLKKINQAKKARKAAILISRLGENGSQDDFVVLEGDKADGLFEAAVTNCLQTGKSAQAEFEEKSYFLNVHLPTPKIVVIGAVHITKALSELARLAGFQLLIIDPRTAFATKERFSEEALYSDWPENVLKNQALDEYTALVAVTHDPKIDDFPILEALRKKCFYVGALGSKKTHAARLERFASQIDQKELKKIHAPIGLDIGASSPQEIAIAIMAEIIQTYRNREI